MTGHDRVSGTHTFEMVSRSDSSCIDSDSCASSRISEPLCFLSRHPAPYPKQNVTRGTPTAMIDDFKAILCQYP